jgi:hypothetical protein
MDMELTDDRRGEKRSAPDPAEPAAPEPAEPAEPAVPENRALEIPPFPWRQFTLYQARGDYDTFCQRVARDNPRFPIPICQAGYECTDWLFQEPRLSVSSFGHQSCVQMWNTGWASVQEYYEQSGKSDLYASLKFLAKAPAHFPPYVAAMMYKQLGCRRVYDPYAGWGDRCVAAMSVGIDYLGVDSNPALEPCFRRLIETFPHTGDVRFLSGKSEQVSLGDFQPDLVFTSPPFWTKSHKLIEAYPECDVDMNRFMSHSLLPMMRSMLPRAGVVLYINESIYRAVERVFGPAEIFLFKRVVSRSDPYGNHLFYWPARSVDTIIHSVDVTALEPLVTPLVTTASKPTETLPVDTRGIISPTDGEHIAGSRRTAPAARSTDEPSKLCQRCETADLARFEPGKKSMCRACANALKRARTSDKKNASRSCVVTTDIDSVAAACSSVLAWRSLHGCISRGSGNDVVYDLGPTVKRLEKCEQLHVTLPGPRKVDGTELKLRFATDVVLIETIEEFRGMTKRYNDLK